MKHEAGTRIVINELQKGIKLLLPGFEPGMLDSKSRVITTSLQEKTRQNVRHADKNSVKEALSSTSNETR